MAAAAAAAAGGGGGDGATPPATPPVGQQQPRFLIPVSPGREGYTDSAIDMTPGSSGRETFSRVFQEEFDEIARRRLNDAIEEFRGELADLQTQVTALQELPAQAAALQQQMQAAARAALQQQEAAQALHQRIDAQDRNTQQIADTHAATLQGQAAAHAALQQQQEETAQVLHRQQETAQVLHQRVDAQAVTLQGHRDAQDQTTRQIAAYRTALQGGQVAAAQTMDAAAAAAQAAVPGVAVPLPPQAAPAWLPPKIVTAGGWPLIAMQPAIAAAAAAAAAPPGADGAAADNPVQTCMSKFLFWRCFVNLRVFRNGEATTELDRAQAAATEAGNAPLLAKIAECAAPIEFWNNVERTGQTPESAEILKIDENILQASIYINDIVPCAAADIPVAVARFYNINSVAFNRDCRRTIDIMCNHGLEIIKYAARSYPTGVPGFVGGGTVWWYDPLLYTIITQNAAALGPPAVVDNGVQ